MRDLNKFKGCLIGGAVGDALGYAVEFMSASSIFNEYGADGITEYELCHGVAEISDDTQMTLFTATGLLTGTTSRMLRGVMGDYAKTYISRSYLDWYRTQTERYPLSDENRSSWLVNRPELFACRAPGNTCLSALAHGGNGTIEHPINQSKGCGGIMRVAPIGIYFAGKGVPEEEIDAIGAKAAALTHGHELGYIPAAMLVHILNRIMDHGESIYEAVQNALVSIPAFYPDSVHMRELLSLMEKAVSLSVEPMDDLAAIRQLGEGWVAEETLAIAVYCALRYSDNFEKGIIASVNHDGDSDSTGAVAGNLLGTALGFDSIPRRFLEKLELKDVILEVAEDLCHDCQMSEYGRGITGAPPASKYGRGVTGDSPASKSDPSDELWKRKYLEMTYR